MATVLSQRAPIFSLMPSVARSHHLLSLSPFPLSSSLPQTQAVAPKHSFERSDFVPRHASTAGPLLPSSQFRFSTLHGPQAAPDPHLLISLTPSRHLFSLPFPLSPRQAEPPSEHQAITSLSLSLSLSLSSLPVSTRPSPLFPFPSLSLPGRASQRAPGHHLSFPFSIFAEPPSEHQAITPLSLSLSLCLATPQRASQLPLTVPSTQLRSRSSLGSVLSSPTSGTQAEPHAATFSLPGHACGKHPTKSPLNK